MELLQSCTKASKWHFMIILAMHRGWHFPAQGSIFWDNCSGDFFQLHMGQWLQSSYCCYKLGHLGRVSLGSPGAITVLTVIGAFGILRPEVNGWYLQTEIHWKKKIVSWFIVLFFFFFLAQWIQLTMSQYLFWHNIWSILIRHQSDTITSDRYITDVHPSVFVIWDRTGNKLLSEK